MGAGISRTRTAKVLASPTPSAVASEAGASLARQRSSKQSFSVIHNLTQLQLDEFREAFNAFDEDGSGSIDEDELRELFRNLGQAPSNDELKKMVNAADTDGNGTIDFEEFATLMAHMMAEHDGPAAKLERVRNAFAIFDADGSGTIDADELRRVMLNLGEPVSVEDVDELLRLFDKDSNGSVDVIEFAACIVEERLLKPPSEPLVESRSAEQIEERLTEASRQLSSPSSSPSPNLSPNRRPKQLAVQDL